MAQGSLLGDVIGLGTTLGEREGPAWIRGPGAGRKGVSQGEAKPSRIYRGDYENRVVWSCGGVERSLMGGSGPAPA